MFKGFSIIDILVALGSTGILAAVFKIINRYLDAYLDDRKIKRQVALKEKKFEEVLKTEQAIRSLLKAFLIERKDTKELLRVIVTEVMDSGALLTPMSNKYITIKEEASLENNSIRDDYQHFKLSSVYGGFILEAKKSEDTFFIDVNTLIDNRQKALYKSADINYEYLVYLKLNTRYDEREVFYLLHAHTTKKLDPEKHLKIKGELLVLANQINQLI